MERLNPLTYELEKKLLRMKHVMLLELLWMKLEIKFFNL